MKTCPACGASLGDSLPSECPRCHAPLQSPTESFEPVGVAEDSVIVQDTVSAGESPALVVRKGAETGERFVIDCDRLSVGRDPESDIFLNDVTVSRSHAVLERSSAGVSIEDSGSLNGTYVNSVRVDKAFLSDGDIVQIGMFQMVYVTGPGSGAA